MPNIYKSLKPTDVSITPFPAYYKFSYAYESGSNNNSPDITFSYGKRFLTESGLRVANKTYEIFDFAVQTFYSAIPYASYGTSKRSYIPDDSVYMLSITQDLFGEKIIPGSFSVNVGASKLQDDKIGNLITYTSGTGSIVGRIFYDKGIALIKPKEIPNINPDPSWVQGTSVDGTGWEFLVETKLTDDLGEEDGVTEPYPGRPTVAGKIATRTGTYWQSGNFFMHTVALNEEYKISGWVYAGATTYRAILNNNTPGSDYAMGYILTFLDSSNAPIAEEIIKTNGPTEYTSGDSGWVFLSKRIKITNPNIAKFTIGTFIDSPYPSGFGYGSPPENPNIVCTPAQAAQGCPGYAWFAGFNIQNLASEPTVGLNETGLYITGGMSLTTNFTSSVKLYENMFKVELAPTDFLTSWNNPSVTYPVQGSSKTPIELQVSGSLLPYVTTIGFYNENNELLMVAKPSVPIQRTSDSIQTFIVKFDTQ